MKYYPDILSLEQNGDFIAALTAYRDLYLKDPKDEGAIYGIAQCALALGNLETAFEFFVKLLIMNHDCAEAYVGRANVLFQYDQRERAMSDLAKAIELDNPASMLRIDCAAILNDNGLTEFAMQSLMPVRDMAFDDFDFKSEWIFCLLANGKTDHADVKPILSSFLKNIEEDPYYTFCIGAYRCLKGEEGALEQLTIFLRDYPEFCERAHILGLALPE
ncbi:MAG: tetratricopeptide repeat protein [Proteobacteria bacterium]|nr:tetratricopeptide repeat protein [Pseudomonadota bacterium]